MRKNPLELTPQQRELMERRTLESARRNPDFLPCAFQDTSCACVDPAGKSKKLFPTEHDALTACSWLNKYRPEQPAQIPYECPETKHWHLRKMN